MPGNMIEMTGYFLSHTVADNAFLAVLNAAEEGRPPHEVIEVKAQVIVLR
jgi:hypothetical protein